jgi:hypothetical protein
VGENVKYVDAIGHVAVAINVAIKANVTTIVVFAQDVVMRKNYKQINN